MSINDELRLQKKRKMYRSHHHLNFWPVKVAKSRKVFFIFDPIQVGLVGLLSWVGRAIITVFLNVTWKRKYLSRFSLLYFIQVNKEIHWWLTPKTSHTSVDCAKKVHYMDSHHSKSWSKGGKTSRGVLIFAKTSKLEQNHCSSTLQSNMIMWWTNNHFVDLTSPKGFLASKCDVGNWIFSIFC